MRKLVITNDDKYINERVRLFTHHMCLHICEVHTIAIVGKCIHETQKNYKFAVTNFNSTLQKSRIFEHQDQRQVRMYISLLLFHDYFMIGFLWSLYLHTVFL